ncbi:MAG: sigma-70 family RNA polymerase sigma factor [Phycisphaerales bacterium]|nr:MAG: sigma-70 family RNA polymerase sigma factor [Phycisphaerales bacterium]
MEHGSFVPAGDAVVADAVRGDREAMQALWQTHRRWIAAVLLTHKPRQVELEDLLQEVAMTVVKRIGTLRDEANVRSWLRTVAINAARAAGRSTNRRPQMTLVGEDVEAQSPPPIDHASSDEQFRRVMDAVGLLPEEYREPLMLRAMHGMRSRQISTILGIAPATIDTRVARARGMLREILHGRERPGNDVDTGAASVEEPDQESDHDRFV